MIYNKLKLGIRIFFLAASIILTSYLLFSEHNYLRAGYASSLIIISLVELYFYLNKINRKVDQFFNSIYWDDFNITLSHNTENQITQQLYSTLNNVANKLKELRKKNLIQLEFIESIVKHAKIGLISLDKNNNINFLNNAFSSNLNYSNINKGDSLAELQPQFWDQIKKMNPGDNKNILLNIEGKEQILYCQYSTFILDKETYKLFSIQNIDSAIEETEIKAWKKLIRILTHEIMNSISPISSLSGSLSEILSEDDIDPEYLNSRLKDGLEAINDRSKGLLRFTDSFRALSKIPDPEPTEIKVSEFFEKIHTYFHDILQRQSIELIKEIIPISLSFFADKHLMEQVFINILKNAIDSLKDIESPSLILKSCISLDKIEFKIIDNGKGISEENLNKVFIPFFTTKENGSGIGLAICKQIIKMHYGEISISSELNSGTTITIMLPATKK